MQFLRKAESSRLAARRFLKVQQLQLQNILWSITKSLGKTLETTQNWDNFSDWK